jgi:putative FmdB family regulatory protein
MPNYDWVCPGCGYELVNVRQTVDEHELGMICPKCGDEMESVIEAVPFILKGDGWGSGGRG